MITDNRTSWRKVCAIQEISGWGPLARQFLYGGGEGDQGDQGEHIRAPHGPHAISGEQCEAVVETPDDSGSVDGAGTVFHRDRTPSEEVFDGGYLTLELVLDLSGHVADSAVSAPLARAGIAVPDRRR
jgi:hypothetical protein